MVICEHVHLYMKKDGYIYPVIEYLHKGSCEICNGFLLCKKENHNNIQLNKKIYNKSDILSLKKQPICFKFNCCAYKISEKDYNEFINTTQTKYNIKGYIEKSNCNDCKIEKEQIMKDNILYTKCLCIHNK